MTFCAHSHLQTDRATCVQVHGTTHKVQRGKRLGFLRLRLSTISVLFVPLLRHAIADNDAVGSDDTLYETAAVLCVIVVFMMMLASLLFHEKNKCINGTLKMPPSCTSPTRASRGDTIPAILLQKCRHEVRVLHRIRRVSDSHGV